MKHVFLALAYLVVGFFLPSLPSVYGVPLILLIVFVTGSVAGYYIRQELRDLEFIDDV